MVSMRDIPSLISGMGAHDRAPDDFRDLRDDGVAEAV
jgi:hypothetical protein